MSAANGRFAAARISLRHLAISLAGLSAVLCFALTAHAVVVRGVVTDQLGVPVLGARVQLIHGKNTAAITTTGPDGSFEVSSGDAGRFLLLTSARTFAPNIGKDFYGGRTDLVAEDVVLSPTEIRTEVSVTASGIPTPLAQLTAPVTLIGQDELRTRVGIIDDLRQSPGVAVTQTGQAGGVASLFVRGANSDSNKVLVDGIPAGDIGGLFDFGTVSSTGLAGLELYRGPNSALYGSDALASVVDLSTPRGTSLRPVLEYSGDAGNLHTWRDEVAVSGTRRRADYFAAYSRFDTSNALKLDEYHSSTAAANLGYNFTANTALRFTLRNADSAGGLPNAHDFYEVPEDGKQSDQDLYSGATLENRTVSGWHNLVRYGIARKREQARYFGNSGTLLTFPNPFPPPATYSEYFGDPVLIRGANGYTTSGQASFFSSDRNQDSNRDELYYQSDYTFPKRITALFGFRYENERGSFITPGAFGLNEQTQRTNFEYNLQLQGELRNRLFYSFGGSLQKNHLYGIAGTPRLGLSYVLVRPDRRYVHGTRLRANAATGVQEPNLAAEFNSLYTQLRAAGDTADIALYRVTPLGPQRSRTVDVGIEQNLVGERLVLKAGYFHNQFSHQLEFVTSQDLTMYFGFPLTAPNGFGAELNSQAFRAQGGELEIEYQPRSRLFVRGGYTYLDAVVSQSFASDATAARGGFPAVNPLYPNIPIGSTSPFVGARPFRRPPHTGYFAVQYTGQKYTAAIKGALASRSDDSTFLGGFDPAFGNSLLLPNRNLDFGYAKLDAYGTYSANAHVTVFTELSNLLNNQHIGPIGYPGLPFTVRAGLKLRIGGD